MGIGYHGIVVVNSVTYELYAAFDLESVEDVFVEETSSGNLDFCFRLRGGFEGAFKCSAAPEAFRLWNRVVKLKGSPSDSMHDSTFNEDMMGEEVLGEKQFELDGHELDAFDDDSDDIEPMTECTEADEMSVAEFSVASSRSRKQGPDQSSVASLISAARANAGSQGLIQGVRRGRGGQANQVDEETWGTVAQIVENATQKVSDMKTITLAAASDLRVAQREAQEALQERNLIELQYKERVRQLEEQVRNFRIRDMDKMMLSSQSPMHDDEDDNDNMPEEKDLFKQAYSLSPEDEEEDEDEDEDEDEEYSHRSLNGRRFTLLLTRHAFLTLTCVQVQKA